MKKLKPLFQLLRDVSITIDSSSPSFQKDLIEKTDILSDLKKDGKVGFFVNDMPVVASLGENGEITVREMKEAYKN